MTPKELVLDFYKNDLMLQKSEVTEFLHDDLIIGIYRYATSTTQRNQF